MSRYSFHNHSGKPGWYTVTDRERNFHIEFQAHRFNETLDAVFPDSVYDAQEIATMLREMGDWLYIHHYSEIFPAPVYELRVSEDDTELHIIRHKEPTMDAKFETDDLDKIAKALAKACEFVRKGLKNQIR